jgi:hypothetical protein
MSMDPIEVTARFDEHGTITPLQFSRKGGTYPVESTGRRWRDDKGFHILVMVSSDRIYELIFRSDEGRWYIGPVEPKRMVV